jgi:hypothetical protein
MKVLTNEEKAVYIKAASIVSVVLLIIGIWLWWVGVYTAKDDVFKAMLSNSLSTRGVTKIIEQQNESGSVNQKAQAQYGARNLVQVVTEINQKTQEGDTKVITNTIATPSDNYVKYQKIEVPNNSNTKLNFDGLVGQWGKQTKPEGGASIFSEATLGIVLFGNLPSNQRAELLSMMQDDSVYKVDYNSVATQDLNGRKVYKYTVEINTKQYVEVLKKYDEMLGLGFAKDLNPEDYATAPAIKTTMYVDVLSRALSKLEYQDGSRVEEFTGYGIQKPIEVPQQSIGRNELEQKLQNILTQ